MRFSFICLLVIACLSATVAGAEDSFTRSGNSIISEEARFQVLTPTLVRMEYALGASFADGTSVVVVKRDWPAADFSVKEADGWLTIDTGKLTVRYRSGSGRFTAENLKIEWNQTGAPQAWAPGMSDPENLGGTLRCLDSITKDVVANYQPDPGLLSRNGWFLLDDSLSPLWDSATQWIVPRPSADSQDWYFFCYGHDYKHALQEFIQLAGPIPMLPRFSMGYWFGARLGYSPREWEEIVSRFREEGLPLDAVMFDVSTWASHIWSNFDWDPVNVPDPRGLTAWLHQHGVKLFLVTHYGPLLSDAKHFKAVRDAMGMSSDTETISFDLARQQDAQLFAQYCLDPLYEDGMDFTFIDGTFAANMAGLNPQMWTNRTVYEAMEQKTGRRGLVVSRTGGWGSHRYPAMITGDTTGYWEVLERSVEFITTSGNALVPFWVHQIGGFGPIDADPEIFARWTQWAALSPLAHAHGINGRRLPWEYGTEGVELYRRWMGLRYRMMPYNYTLMHQTHQSGVPMQRPLYLEYPEEDEAYNYPGEYLWGPDLLVAPVAIPAGPDGSLLCTIWLPPGQWFDYSTGECYAGGQVLQYDCPRDRMPIFVRAGAIVPMQPAMGYSDERPVDPLTLQVWAGASGHFELYEDDGASLDYHDGDYALTAFDFKPYPRTTGQYELELGAAKGKFAGQPGERSRQVEMHGLLKPAEVLWSGGKLTERSAPGDPVAGEWTWDPREMVTTIALPSASIREASRLTLTGAGSFEDYALARRMALLRLRLREVKQIAKVKAFELLGGYVVKMMPKVIRTIEDVQYKLEAMLEQPAATRKQAPDLAAMVQSIVPAIMHTPCEVTRYLGEEKIQLTDVIDDGVKIGETAEFSPESRSELLTKLFDLRLFAHPRKLKDAPGWEVLVHVHYDADLTGPAEIEIQAEAPAGWSVDKPVPTTHAGEWTFKLNPEAANAAAISPVRVTATLRGSWGDTKVGYAIKPVDLKP